jgi:hypothetical protein
LEILLKWNSDQKINFKNLLVMKEHGSNAPEAINEIWIIILKNKKNKEIYFRHHNGDISLNLATTSLMAVIV